MTSTDDTKIDLAWRRLWAIWWGLSASLFISLGFGLLIGYMLPQPLVTELPVRTLLSAFYAAAILLFAVMLLVRRTLARPPQGNAIRLTGEAKLQRYTVALIISLGCADLIGVLAFILCLFVRAPEPFWILMLVALSGAWLCRPQRDELTACQQD